MPFYRCTVPTGLLEKDQKAQIAGAITNLHCGLNPGTPRDFVHVVFDEVAAGNGWCGGRPSPKSVIIGMIRAGRTREIKDGLLFGISELWQKVAGQDPIDIVVGVVEIPARDVVEAGWILPEPGDEEAWLVEHGLTGD